MDEKTAKEILAQLKIIVSALERQGKSNAMRETYLKDTVYLLRDLLKETRQER